MLQSCAPYFNLALVYNHVEVSQDADAIDSLERALQINPDYEDARKQLAVIKPRLEKLANSVINQGESGLAIEDRYQFYINPFELLGADRDDELEDYDAKRIKKLKGGLLHEIELEDGAIEHLHGLCVDRSRAISICEELNDETVKEYHWLVFSEPYLLGFLSRGNVRHFLCFEEYKPLDLLEELDSEWSGFREWLSIPFARQFDLVLTRALRKKRVPLIESLFDGRRWILREHEEQCFEGARRQVEHMLVSLRNFSDKAKKNKPELLELSNILNDSRFISIINLLPQPFRDQQTEAVSLVRDTAIAAFNQHSDSDLSKSILSYSKNFSFKSAALKQRLEEDFKQIEKLIAQERKHEAKLRIAKTKVAITKEGVEHGSIFFPAESIIGVRWGILFTGHEYSPQKEYNYLMIFKDNRGHEITFSWQPSDCVVATNPFDQPSALNFNLRISEIIRGQNKQAELNFDKLMNAAMNYIVPTIYERIQNSLDAGKEISIGPCTLRKDALILKKSGWFTSKKIAIPWSSIKTKIENGVLQLYDKTNPKARVEMGLRETENAVILQILTNTNEKL